MWLLPSNVTPLYEPFTADNLLLALLPYASSKVLQGILPCVLTGLRWAPTLPWLWHLRHRCCRVPSCKRGTATTVLFLFLKVMGVQLRALANPGLQ